MMSPEHLPYFLSEEIYIISDREPLTEKKEQPVNLVPLPFAFFHDSKSKDELALLNKIITACKLDDFEIIDHLNHQDIPFNKAVIFISEASNFYDTQSNTLYSKPLSVLKNSQEEKGKLWGALQNFK